MSRAAKNSFGLLNAPGAGGLKRKILIIAQQMPAFLLPEERLEVANAEQIAVLCGRGSVIHRLGIALERGTKKEVALFILPQDEVGAGTAATGTLTVGGTTASTKSTWGVRINGDKDLEAEITTEIGDDPTVTAAALLVELNKLLDSPATQAAVAGVITYTAKNKGTFGNFMDISVIGDVPADLTAVVSAMSGGATDPDIDTALVATGNNQENDTDLSHGYDIDGTTLNKLSGYNGEGNTFDGLYLREISRPFRSMVSDNVKDASAWTTFLDDDDRKVDRTSGAISAPTCTAHPSELAAAVVGIMARVNTDSPAGLFEGEKLTWVPVPPASGRYWELGDDGGFSLRDSYMENGLTPLIVIDGVYTLQNVNSFYHPDAVTDEENGWIDMSDISITQNILQFYKDLWDSTDWTGVTFVENRADVGTVNPDGSQIDRSKIKDRTEVVTTLIQSFKNLAGFGWLYNSDYSITDLQENPQKVALKASGLGFDYDIVFWYRLKGYQKDGQGLFNVSGVIAA